MSIKTRTSGIMVNINVEPSVAPATYTGPGDIVGGAAGAWGLRAFTQAIAGSATKIIRIRDDTTTTEQDFGTNSDGTLDTAGIAAFLAGHAGSITKLYDQSGNAKDMDVVPFGRPGYSSSPVAAVAADANAALETTGSITLTQPYYVSAVINSGAPAGTIGYWGCAGGTPRCGFRQATGLFFGFAGTAETGKTGTTGTWYVHDSLFNGVSSQGWLNGATDGAGNMGADNASGVQGFMYAVDHTTWGQGGGTSYVREIWVWDTDNSADRAALQANANTFWGLGF